MAIRRVSKSTPKTSKNAGRSAVFADNVRSLLERDHLSQREAADEIGVSYKWVRRLAHHGLVWPDKRTSEDLGRFAALLGVSPDALWDGNLMDQPQIPDNYVLIKWTGGKRRQADEIISHFPEQIRTYYEPFLGGGAVLLRLLDSGISVERYRCSDLCEPLIQIWQTVMKEPRRLASHYEETWHRLNEKGKPVYDAIRLRFNSHRDPCDFFFLLRCCRIGLVRFNRRGEFTSAFGRIGLPPDQVRRLIIEVGKKLRDVDVEFFVRDCQTIRPKVGDFMYLDPPYRLKHPSVMYSGGFDHQKLFEWLRKQKCGYAMSLNGFFGEEDHRMDVPEELYDQEHLIDSGVSAFRRMGGKPTPDQKDALYVRRGATCVAMG